MASRGVNKVILVGNLGQDPEVRYMPSGGAVANFTLATSESWRDKQTGEMKEQTEWHRGAPAGGGQQQGGWGQPQQPQGGNQFSGGAQSRPQQQAPAAPSNEPPMDFDDDIPF